MSKRSDFKRIARDFYRTPLEAVVPLLPHLSAGTSFFEPCAGDGILVRHLENAGHVCVGATDIEPHSAEIIPGDATKICVPLCSRIITNPPWDRKVLHPIIENLSPQYPTWLLFDADWAHTKQAIPYMPFLCKIVSIGRIKWIPGTTMTGKDNCCWYLFDSRGPGDTQFIGRIR